jgi:hypothetical protein
VRTVASRGGLRLTDKYGEMMSFLCALCYSITFFAVLNGSKIAFGVACLAWLIYSTLYYFKNVNR